MRSYSDVVTDALDDRGFSVTTSSVWCQATPVDDARRAPTTPRQGWKLHLSAGVTDADAILAAALPILTEHRVLFKVAADRTMLARLNDGQAGITQAGKFMTLYPTDDAAAVELARRLDEATDGLHGPWIASDRPLRRASVVHYRFGSFVAGDAVDADGETVALLDSPDGPVPDVRHGIYLPPNWVADPFLAAGVAEPLPPPSHVLGRRYVIIDTLHRSTRGAVQLAVDARDETTVVLKRAHRWAAIADDGRDATARLEDERRCLEALGVHPGFPRVGPMLVDNDDVVLVLEDIDGDGLEMEIERRRLAADPYSSREALRLVAAIADLIGIVHEAGWIHRDLKPGNIRFRSDRRPVLIDFELAGPPGPIDTAGVRGTRGYLAPERRDLGPGCPADDVYALGVMLHELLTLEYPWDVPDTWALADHDARSLRPELSAAAAEARDRLLGPAAQRPRDGHDAARLLRCAAERLDRVAAPADASPTHAAATEIDPEQARSAAAELVEWFRRSAHRTSAGLRWSPAEHPGMTLPAGLHSGDAGIVVALACAARIGIDATDSVLTGAADHLVTRPVVEVPHTEGSLFGGRLGVALALDEAADVLGRPDLSAAARVHADTAAAAPLSSPDVLGGAAGRILGHLLLHRRHGSAEDLAAARRAARFLVNTAVRADVDDPAGIAWVMPDAGPLLAGRAFRGYAHGTAGIADALLAFAGIAGDDDARAVGLEATAALVATASPVLPDGSGRGWFEPERPITGQGLTWSYGSPGMALALRRAVDTGAAGAPAAETLAAALRASAAATYLGPSRAHGLAGSIDCLLDARGGDVTALAAARHHGRLLCRSLVAAADGIRPQLGDGPLGPGLMKGAAGMLIALCRLADPELDNPLRPSGEVRR